jgi:Flp pilus assembly pilin Flp
MSGEEGQDLVEYALVIAFLVVTATASSKPMAIVLTTTLSNIATAFTNAVS